MQFISSKNIWRQSYFGAFLLICSNTVVWASNFPSFIANNRLGAYYLQNLAELNPENLPILKAPNVTVPTSINADAIVQYEEGMNYLLGIEGKQIDNHEAIRLLKIAADAQYAKAQVALGDLYMTGLGNALKEDKGKAIELFMEAAKQNLPEAIAKLGYAYIYGIPGVLIKNSKFGFDLIKTLDPKLAVTQFHLAFFYHHGIPGVIEPNLPLALELYQMAADQGYADAQVSLGNIYINGIADALSPNKQKAEQLAIAAAKQGNATGRFNLASFYLYGGVEIKPDLKQAMELYQLAAAQNLPSAKYMLSIVFYDKGISGIVAQNTGLAVKLYKEAAEQGLPEAQYGLAIRYFYGQYGTLTDKPRAIKLFKLAAKQNHAKAQFFLAQLYISDLTADCPKDMPLAIELLHSSAKQNYAHAQYFLGVCYRRGFGVSMDSKQASKFFLLAADRLTPKVKEDIEATISVDMFMGPYIII